MCEPSHSKNGFFISFLVTTAKQPGPSIFTLKDNVKSWPLA